MSVLELYGSLQCPYTRDLREWLDWNRRNYREYSVDTDLEAYAQLQTITRGAAAVPVLVEDGRIIQIGWQGRSCFLSGSPTAEKPLVDQSSEEQRSLSSNRRSVIMS